MSLGLGLALGPVIGSAAYTFLSYFYTFIFFSGYVLFFGIICLCNVPARLNEPPQTTERTTTTRVSYVRPSEVDVNE